jgi:hypothetical protein
MRLTGILGACALSGVNGICEYIPFGYSRRIELGMYRTPKSTSIWLRNDGMAISTDLHPLVDSYGARFESLNLSGGDQEEFSTMLCRLDNQADRVEPNYAVVVECVNYLSRYAIPSTPNAVQAPWALWRASQGVSTASEIARRG